MTTAAWSLPLKKEISLLVSRLSGHGRAERLGRETAASLRLAGWDVDIQFTDAADDPRSLASHAPAQLVGAVGGDGYVAAVARGVALAEDGASRILLPLPGGTGNDFCRAVGIGTSVRSHIRVLEQLTADLLPERVRSLDGMWIMGPAKPEPHLAFGTVSLGLDAAANVLANEGTWLRGSLAYTWAGVRAFLTQSHQVIRGEVDGTAHDFTGWIASVSNTGWMGGGINLVPTSRMDDGLLEVFNVGPTGRLRALPLLARVLSHRDPKSSLVRLHQGKTIRLESELPMPAMADGDLVSYTPIEVRAAPSILPVLT